MEISKTSLSIIVNSFIPAAVRYNAKGEPKPPAPICKTLIFEIISCPFSPIKGDIICLVNLSFCFSVKIPHHFLIIFLIFFILSSISIKISPRFASISDKETKITLSFISSIINW